MLAERLSKDSGVSLSRLRRIQENASLMYKTYSIPKKNGGTRTISQPAPELKAVQRWLAHMIFNRLPISSAATAYKAGASIRSNATAHKNCIFTVHLDFQDFFPSFQGGMIESFLKDKTILSAEDVRFCSAMVCRYGHLTIGAPSSPAVTNAVMYSFDASVIDWCSTRDLVYTRYADDINISSQRADSLFEVEDFIRDLCEKFPYANLKINEQKTAYLSRKYKRAITGLVITPEGKISIGRTRKREIKAMVHKYLSGDLQEIQFWRLGGLLAFSMDVEPGFIASLKRKYGEDLIDGIVKRRTPRGLKYPPRG